ncbi:MAG: FAD-dependent thymidylate synthase, partial [Campylobacterota bacterium]|nr:FAD-dependent thymidylate synthase [Campylobacterota bacterium]
MAQVKLVSVTTPSIDELETAEELIAYCARVSNPTNQLNNETADKLLAYCAKHAHWSIFEMVDVCVEIQTTRDIGRQILRHRSATFQEFSQRYAQVSDSMFTT